MISNDISPQDSTYGNSALEHIHHSQAKKVFYWEQEGVAEILSGNPPSTCHFYNQNQQRPMQGSSIESI